MDKQDPRRTPTDQELAEVNAHWDDNGQVYDPNRGDHVDHLNDTTPEPPLPHYPRTQRRPKNHHGWLWLLLFFALGGAAYYYIYTHKPADPSDATTSTVAPSTTKKSAAATTKHYDSPTYFLGLDYPLSWKLTEGTSSLTIVSPKTTLKTASGKQVQGYIRVSVQNKQTVLPEFAKGSATAIIESQKISYKKPTQNQRAQTYISFASYATTVGNGWDAVYVTGDNGYQVGQVIPQTDILQDDPLVTVSFLNCTDQTCSGTPTPYTLNVSEWKNAATNKPILSILQSLSFN